MGEQPVYPISTEAKTFVAEGILTHNCDYSQAEARVVAYEALARELIALFDDPARDVHRENASRIFGKAVEDITGDERYLAKRAVHALNYGMEPARFVEVINTDAVDHWGKKGTGIRITLKEAQELSDRYFALYPEIKGVYWAAVEEALRTTRQLSTPFGWTRTFYGRYGGKMLKEAYATKPQATIGQLCRIAVRKVGEFKGCSLIPSATVHDSVLCQAPEEQAEEAALALKSLMDTPIPIHGVELRVPVDIAIGRNWGNYDERENPLGLRKVK